MRVKRRALDNYAGNMNLDTTGGGHAQCVLPPFPSSNPHSPSGDKPSADVEHECQGHSAEEDWTLGLLLPHSMSFPLIPTQKIYRT